MAGKSGTKVAMKTTVAMKWVAHHTTMPGRLLVGKLLVMAAILAVSVTACKKTDSGDLQVEKPVIGTVTDTLNIPKVEVGTDTTKVTVPAVEVKKDTVSIKTPTVKIKR
jgi:hypothetical protein